MSMFSADHWKKGPFCSPIWEPIKPHSRHYKLLWHTKSRTNKTLKTVESVHTEKSQCKVSSFLKKYTAKFTLYSCATCPLLNNGNWQTLSPSANFINMDLLLTRLSPHTISYFQHQFHSDSFGTPILLQTWVSPKPGEKEISPNQTKPWVFQTDKVCNSSCRDVDIKITILKTATGSIKDVRSAGLKGLVKEMKYHLRVALLVLVTSIWQNLTSFLIWRKLFLGDFPFKKSPSNETALLRN